MNKHGYRGVRKRNDYPHRLKPYFARIDHGSGKFEYSRYCATAEEAAAEYARMRESSPSMSSDVIRQ